MDMKTLATTPIHFLRMTVGKEADTSIGSAVIHEFEYIMLLKFTLDTPMNSREYFFREAQQANFTRNEHAVNGEGQPDEQNEGAENEPWRRNEPILDHY